MNIGNDHVSQITPDETFHDDHGDTAVVECLVDITLRASSRSVVQNLFAILVWNARKALLWRSVVPGLEPQAAEPGGPLPGRDVLLDAWSSKAEGSSILFQTNCALCKISSQGKAL